MRPRSSALMVVVALVLGACGPRLDHLIANNHYREAICAAVDRPNTVRPPVTEALVEDLGLLAHVHLVSAEELEPLLGEETAEVQAKARFIRVRLQSDVLPIKSVQLGAAVRARGRTGAGAAPVSWRSLAWATEERLPPSQRRRTYATGANVLRLLGAALTLGTSLIFSPFRAEEIEVRAPQSEFVRLAPLASALHREMATTGCRPLTIPGAFERSDEPMSGQVCERFFMLESSPSAQWELVIQQRFIADRANDTQSCTLEHQSVIDLETLGELAATHQERFGPRMRPVRDLTP